MRASGSSGPSSVFSASAVWPGDEYEIAAGEHRAVARGRVHRQVLRAVLHGSKPSPAATAIICTSMSCPASRKSLVQVRRARRHVAAEKLAAHLVISDRPRARWCSTGRRARRACARCPPRPAPWRNSRRCAAPRPCALASARRGAASSNSGMVARPLANSQRPATMPAACRTLPGCSVVASRAWVIKRDRILAGE